MPTLELQRLTTRYLESHDRLRLSGEDEHGSRVCMWLTQRMANRLVASLSQWLEKNPPATTAASPTSDQPRRTQTAVPIESVPADNADPHWLIEHINLRLAPHSLELTFAENTSLAPSARISLSHSQVLDWLGIVQGQFFLADWPTAGWPTFLRIPARTETSPSVQQTLH